MIDKPFFQETREEKWRFKKFEQIMAEAGRRVKGPHNISINSILETAHQYNRRQVNHDEKQQR